MTFDGKAFGAEIVGVVKGYLEKELAPLSARIDDLQKRIDALPAAVDVSSDLAALKSAVEAIVIPELPHLPELPDIATMVDKAVSTAMEALPVPNSGKDGVGLAGTFIDREGHLAITLSSGEVKNLGPVVGKDGDPGKDGFGFEDLDVAYDGEKTITLKFSKGETVKEFPLFMPIVLDRGVYRDGSEYKPGDAVTWAGSVWIAQKDTTAKPDVSGDWRLSVKRGRDGKDGVVKDARPVTSVRVGVPSAGE